MEIRNTLASAVAVAAALLASALPATAADPQSLSAVAEEDRITVLVGGEEFTSYLFGSEHKYPFFYPVVGPLSGESVTAWDQEPYPHHSSLYLSLDWVVSEGVERGNYWQPRDELDTGQVFSRKARVVEAGGERVVLEDETDWVVTEAEVQQFRERRRVEISAPSPTVRVMDFEFHFEVLVDLAVRATGHYFFSARMTPQLAVGCEQRGPEWAPLGTGRIVDSEGNLDEEGTREKASPWAAYYGEHHGVTEGLAIIQHPSNSYHPGLWVSRDYGFISPSSFTFIDEPVEMNAGDELSFRYRVVVFSGDHEEADIAAWHEDFVAGP